MSEVTQYTVYKIDHCGSASSSHGVNRSETWIITPDAVFNTFDAATTHARNQTRNLPEFILLSERLSKTRVEEFLTEFMKNDLYLIKNQFFVGYPPIGRIKTLLRLSGVKIELTNK